MSIYNTFIAGLTLMFFPDWPLGTITMGFGCSALPLE